MITEENYLTSVKQQFQACKVLGEKAIAQIREEKLFVRMNEGSNSIAMIIQHMAGNMLSRWTDFLITDGEKEWRRRDEEFEPHLQTKEMMMRNWEKGWECLFNALENLELGCKLPLNSVQSKV